MKNSRDGLGSFRDPSGFLFYRHGYLYRQVNSIYREDYNHLMNSGLYRALVDSALLIPHEETDVKAMSPEKAFITIRPEQIPFVSYPYEWSFSQLRDAALTTLEVQKRSLDFGMTLKDCSAYNIQFRQGRPVFVDTLSFKRYREGQPWIAYRQFCQHFLAPLALMSYVDTRLSQMFRIHIDGIPLDLASSLLPFHTRLRLSLLIHIHLHALSQRYYAGRTVKISQHRMSRLSMVSLIDSLQSAIQKLKCPLRVTEWYDYYVDSNYSEMALKQKRELVSQFLDKISPRVVWDLGANIGMFSRIAGDKGIQTICFDSDPACVDRNYRECIAEGRINILPLLVDLTNPSPGIGWQNQERMSLDDRGPADTVLALALIHHLTISNNTPFGKIVDFFATICNSLIIEFVPKNDSQIQRLLATREDIFSDYSRDVFEKEFEKRFIIQDSRSIADSERVLYLMIKR